MEAFNPWTLFVDIGIISLLLLLGKLMRVKIKFIQKLFIPPSLLAGFIGLALGPHGFDVLPISSQTGTYAGILITFIFGALPLTSKRPKATKKLEPCGSIRKPVCCYNGPSADYSASWSSANSGH